MLQISKNISIASAEIELIAIRSQGTGGQNVNKISSAIHLRFDIKKSSLDAVYKNRLLQLKDKRISKKGILIIKAQQYRTQEKNRTSALQRLKKIIESIVKDANIWLDGNMPLEQYKPPFSNTFCSHTYTINTENIEQLIQAAIQTTASLAPLNFLEQKIESVETIVETGGLAKRFVTKVKSTVVEMSPTLTKNFNVKIGNMHRYHFVGDKYAANLGAMNPSSPYNSINQAKRLLWDLSVIGQYDWTVEKKELIIYMPEDDKITYSKKQYENAKDTLSRFEEEADKKEIMLFTTCSAKHASERLIKAA